MTSAEAAEPLALVVDIEKLAPDQRAHPDREIISGRDGDSCCGGIGRILPCVVIGLEGSRLGRSLKIAEDASTKAYEELPRK